MAAAVAATVPALSKKMRRQHHQPVLKVIINAFNERSLRFGWFGFCSFILSHH
jgi:hypothetical protein